MQFSHHYFIIYIDAFPAVTCQNVSQEKDCHNGVTQFDVSLSLSLSCSVLLSLSLI